MDSGIMGKKKVRSGQWHLGKAPWKGKKLKYNFGDYVLL